MVQALVETAVVGLVRAVHELEAWTGPLNLEHVQDYEECGPELTLIKPNPARAAAYAELIEASEVER